MLEVACKPESCIHAMNDAKYVILRLRFINLDSPKGLLARGIDRDRGLSVERQAVGRDNFFNCRVERKNDWVWGRSW